MARLAVSVVDPEGCSDDGLKRFDTSSPNGRSHELAGKFGKMHTHVVLGHVPSDFLKLWLQRALVTWMLQYISTAKVC